jgi:hypothetical protein
VKVFVSVVTRMHDPAKEDPLLSACQMGGQTFSVDSLVGESAAHRLPITVDHGFYDDLVDYTPPPL